MRSKKKILFVLPRGVGGAQKMTILIANILKKDDYDIGFIVVGKKNESDMTYLIPREIPVEYIYVKNAWDFLSLRMWKKFRFHRPDYVFSSVMYLNVRVVIASKIYGKAKCIIRNDNMLNTVGKNLLYLMKIIYPMAHKIIAQHHEMKADLEQKLHLRKEKVCVLNNPVDVADLKSKATKFNPYSCLNKDSVKYVWTGNFMPSGTKGQDVLLKAFSIVFRDNPNAHLFLLGLFYENSSFYKDILRLIHENKMEKNVHILGYKENPYPYVLNADVFVLPSRVEGCPNSLIEATLLNKPVVATTCVSVIGQIVHNGYNGYLVPSEDFASMALAMKNAVLLKNFSYTYKQPSLNDISDIFC